MGRGQNSKRKAGSNPRLVVSQSQSLHRRHLPNDEGEEDQCNHALKVWVININDCLDRGVTYDSGRSWTIHRVSDNLRNVHKSAFVPKIVSIGPLNYLEREGRVQAMEEHKMRFLVRLLGGKFDGKSRCGESTVERGREESTGDVDHNDDGRGYSRSVCLDDLVSAMEGLEHKARACYSESFDDINSADFIQMLVVDGCFIVQLLRLYYDQARKEAQSKGAVIVDDPIFTTRWMLRTLQRDLLTLENQLPFFVLEKLFALINKTDPEVASVPLQELVVTFFNPLLPREDPASKLDATRSYHHLLDIFRATFLKSVHEKVGKNKDLDREISKLNPDGSVSTVVRERQLQHFTSELQEAGVKLRKRKDSDLLDIVFDNGTLRIPPLSLDDNTVPLFLNFVAYEQCDEQANPFFTHYFMFFDSLVNGPNDVQILHKHGIINHLLGSHEDVADLLHKLCREIVYDLDQCHLHGEIKKVNEYCKPYDESICRVWWRNLMRTYFSSPWAFLSLLAAIILLMLTVLQTFYTVYPYYRSN